MKKDVAGRLSKSPFVRSISFVCFPFFSSNPAFFSFLCLFFPLFPSFSFFLFLPGQNGSTLVPRPAISRIQGPVCALHGEVHEYMTADACWRYTPRNVGPPEVLWNCLASCFCCYIWDHSAGIAKQGDAPRQDEVGLSWQIHSATACGAGPVQSVFLLAEIISRL